MWPMYWKNRESTSLLFQEARDVKEDLLQHDDPYHPHLATSYNNIGTVLKRMHYLACATTRSNVALLHQSLGHYDQALTESQHVLQMRKGTLGEEHINTALSYNNIGAILNDMGRYEEALTEYQTSLRIIEKISSDSTSTTDGNPRIASAHNNIGGVLKHTSHSNLVNVYTDLRRYKEALQSYRTAIAIQTSRITSGGASIGRTGHPELAISYNNYGMFLSNQLGRYDEAMEECRKALAIQQATYGSVHPRVAKTHNNLGGILYGRGGCYEEALVEYRKGLSIREATMGKVHEATATSHINIANALLRLSEQEGAAAATIEHNKKEAKAEFETALSIL